VFAGDYTITLWPLTYSFFAMYENTATDPSAWEIIQQTWQLNQTQAQCMHAYLTVYGEDIVEYNMLLTEGLFVHRTVDSWLRNGVDALINSIMPEKAPCNLFINDTSAAEAQATKPISLFYTGKNEISQIGQYINFQGQTNISGVWADAIEVKGTEGFQFGPNNDKADVFVWTAEMMRSVEFHFEEDSAIYDLSLYKYYPIDSVFGAPEPEYYQTIAGFANLTNLKQNVPIFISPTNLYSVDPAYQAKVNGMNPTGPEDDGIVIEIEPYTGATMRAHKRFQINVFLDPFTSSQLNGMNFNTSKNTFYPVLYLDETSQVTKDIADKFYQIVFRARMVFNVSFYLGVIMGSFLTLLGFYFVVSSLWRMHRRRMAGWETLRG